jgi:hypothetical protein
MRHFIEKNINQLMTAALIFHVIFNLGCFYMFTHEPAFIAKTTEAKIFSEVGAYFIVFLMTTGGFIACLTRKYTNNKQIA